MNAPILASTIFTVLHLFSGSGGLAKGFHDAGFASAGNIDLDPRACLDLRNLCGTPAIEADIGAMGPADLLALVPECPDVAATSAPCLPGDGLVMTPSGPRRMDSMRAGDLVLTHTGRYCRVDKVNARDYAGNLYGLRLQGTLDTDIQWYTDEHPIWVRRIRRGTDKIRTLRETQWVPAGKVKVDDRVGFPVPREVAGTAAAFVGQFGNPQTTVRSGVAYTTPRIHDLRGEALNPALWFLLGAYIGDGDRRNKGSYTLRYSVGARDSEAFALVSDALLALGLRFSVAANDGEKNVRIAVSSRHLWQLCGLFGSSSHTKHIPEVLMGLEDGPMRALVRGLRATDGSNRPNGWCIGSVSLDLLRGLQRLALRLGVFGSITRLARAGKAVIEGRTVNISDSYTLAFVRDPMKTCYQFEDGMVWQRVKRIYVRETIEPVWNLEVDEDHTYCSPLIATHNCVGFSGCLPEATSKTVKYQAFNSLALHGVQLLLEAWKGARTGRKVPGMIVFENVPRIMTRGKKLLEHMIGLLHAEGYAVDQRTHDCGELGRALAQKRRRYLLVARHMPTVLDFLRKPPAYTPLAIREVLWQLAPPRPGGPDHMHRLPSLSAKNWLRLACICAGGDWRDLPAEVWLYYCESADLEAVTGIRWSHCAGRHDGKLGVLDWSRPSKTIIGKARVCNTWNSVADPRVDWPADKHGGRPDCYGVVDEQRPSGTVRGEQTIYSSKASTPDPRVEHVDTRVRPGGNPPRRDGYGVEDADDPASTVRGRHDVWAAPASTTDPRVDTSIPPRSSRLNGGRGVEDPSEPAHAVIAEGTVSNTRASVADPRLVRPQRSDAYGVHDAGAPSGTIVGAHAHDNVAGSVADPRVSVELGHIPQRGTMGVQDAAEPADTVRGNHSIRQAPGAVDDPRVERGAKAAKPSLPRRYNERGWPVATHYLVRLDDGRLVLYGPAVDFTDNRPRADLVIVALDGTLHRPFTDAELALLMGFPLGFEFCGPSSCSKSKPGEPLKTGRRKRIGNAVPPPTAYAIAQECMATLVASANGGFRLATGDVWVERAEAAVAA